MTVEEFRKHDQYPALWAMELQTNHILRTVLEVMEDAHPARYAVHGDNNDDVSPTRAAIELGFTRGFSKYGDTLKLLAQRKSKLADVGEPTYAQPPQEETHA